MVRLAYKQARLGYKQARLGYKQARLGYKQARLGYKQAKQMGLQIFPLHSYPSLPTWTGAPPPVQCGLGHLIHP